MSNQFDTDNAPTTEPTEIVAGGFTAWRRTDLSADYSPDDYQLSYEFRSEGDPSRQITVIGAADSGDYLMQISSATSAEYEVAAYRWSAYITRTADNERIRVESGFTEVTPDRAIDSTDPRDFAKKMVDLIEAAIERRATNSQLDVLAYSLGVETSATRDPEKLLVWRTYWRGECIRRNQMAVARKGRRHSGVIRTAF